MKRSPMSEIFKQSWGVIQSRRYSPDQIDKAPFFSSGTLLPFRRAPVSTASDSLQDPRRPVCSVAPSGFLCPLRVKITDTLWAPTSLSSSDCFPVFEVPSKCYLTTTARKVSAYEAPSFLGAFSSFSLSIQFTPRFQTLSKLLGALHHLWYLPSVAGARKTRRVRRPSVPAQGIPLPFAFWSLRQPVCAESPDPLQIPGRPPSSGAPSSL